MWSFLALVTIASASSSLLERYSSELSTVPLGSFVALDDFKELLSRVMMRTDILLNEHGVDLVEEMRVELGFETRQNTIEHFFDRNVPELNEVIKNMQSVANDLSIAAAFAKPVAYRSFFAPLAHAIRVYLTNRRQMCLYDSLPRGLRKIEKYLEYFTPIDPETLRVTPLSKHGHLTLIHDDSLESSLNFMIEGCVIYSSDESLTRMIDVRAGCAVAVTSGIQLWLFPFTGLLLFPVKVKSPCIVVTL